jgi:hypothetical protein
MNELLPFYANGSLTGPERDEVRSHVAGCPQCRADLASWQSIASAVTPAQAPPAPPAPPAVIGAVLTRSAFEPAAEAPAGRLRYLASLVLAEARLIRLAVPIASVLVMALGVALVLIGGGSNASQLLALVAPIVAAAGVAGAYRSRHDPVAELVAATPTSSRFLLLIRLALVVAYDLVLALAASAVLAGTTAGAGIDALVGAWLGPMALLSSLSLLLAVRLGPDVALGAAVGLWTLRALAGTTLPLDGRPARLIVEMWSTNPTVLLVSLVLGAAAVVVAGRSGPFAAGGR